MKLARVFIFLPTVVFPHDFSNPCSFKNFLSYSISFVLPTAMIIPSSIMIVHGKSFSAGFVPPDCRLQSFWPRRYPVPMETRREDRSAQECGWAVILIRPAKGRVGSHYSITDLPAKQEVSWGKLRYSFDFSYVWQSPRGTSKKCCEPNPQTTTQ